MKFLYDIKYPFVWKYKHRYPMDDSLFQMSIMVTNAVHCIIEF
jgi:hypothetical protein